MNLNFIISNVRAVVRFPVLILWTISLMAVGIITYNISRKYHEKLVKLYFSGAIKIFGIEIEEEGLSQIPKDSMLFVSNHTSYVDILVLGSKIKVRFTPKIEISKWLLIKYLVKMSLPVYIHRNASKSLEQKKQIKEIIEGGDSILIFPESTTNDGNKVLPFKSSLFSVAEPEDDDELDEKIGIQPISIVYTHIDGEIANAANMDKVAWYGDMKFLPHFLNLLAARGAKVKITYHSEVYYEDFGDRKSLSKHCEDVISQGVRDIKDSNENLNEKNQERKNSDKRLGKH